MEKYFNYIESFKNEKSEKKVNNIKKANVLLVSVENAPIKKLFVTGSDAPIGLHGTFPVQNVFSVNWNDACFFLYLTLKLSKKDCHYAQRIRDTRDILIEEMTAEFNKKKTTLIENLRSVKEFLAATSLDFKNIEKSITDLNVPQNYIESKYNDFIEFKQIKTAEGIMSVLFPFEVPKNKISNSAGISDTEWLAMKYVYCEVNFVSEFDWNTRKNLEFGNVQMVSYRYACQDCAGILANIEFTKLIYIAYVKSSSTQSTFNGDFFTTNLNAKVTMELIKKKKRSSLPFF